MSVGRFMGGSNVCVCAMHVCMYELHVCMYALHVCMFVFMYAMCMNAVHVRFYTNGMYHDATMELILL